MQCISVDFTSCGLLFIREECRISSLCSPLISICLFVSWRKTVHRTRETHEYYLCYTYCYAITPRFFDGNTDTNKSLFRKIKYNLVIETIWGRFFVICFITWLIPATCEELDDNVCVLCNYVDIFLQSFAPLYWNSWKPNLFNPSKKLFYYGEIFNVFWGKIWCNI